ncbi:DUF4411 family protein [Methylotenera mobilis]|uniref:DUF4411 family protein n=1 Tax=Methylotenera mobilis TaxID=359408 RepID=UPI0003755E3D|nr:DUF4411 family protein [Methylotenera mobilis]PPC97166.1 MAG: DUF4411 domain-containing protein [Methylotenera sp.]
MIVRDTAKYCIDTSSIIHAWLRAYPPKNFHSFWERVEELINSGVIIASVEVINELKKKDDAIHKWATALPSHFSVDIDDNQQALLAYIMGTHPRLVDTTKGRSEGDPFVISLALCYNPPLIVISEENYGKVSSPKIPDVCRAEGVTCIRLVELVQRENWIL